MAARTANETGGGGKRAGSAMENNPNPNPNTSRSGRRNPGAAVSRALQALVIVALLLHLAISPVGAENAVRKEGEESRGVAEPNPKVPVATVAWLTLAMAIATGLGAVPFFFVQLDPRWGGICNGVAGGVMLAASFDLIQEGQRFGGGSWVVVGILSGGLFILVSQHLVHQAFGEVSMLDVKGADVPKMILVVSIMTLHSFGEGSGVGVSFAGPKGLAQGLMVTIAIAVHNIPEGLAVSLLLSSQGMSPKQSMLWSIFTSLPQPLVAVPAFLCAEAFHKFLPFCMGFAGGCMIWMVMAEVMPDSFKDASKSEVATAATLAVTSMEALSALLDTDHGMQNVDMLVAYVSFGAGPLVGALLLTALHAVAPSPMATATATATAQGVTLAVATWKPLQMVADGRGVFRTLLLFLAGALLPPLLRRHVDGARPRPSPRAIFGPGSGGFEMSAAVRKPCVSVCLMVFFYTFVEGVAMGVAATTSGYSSRLLLPVALHGLPRGVCVASIVYGETGSKKGSFLVAAVLSFAGPFGGVFAALTGVRATGLEHVLVFVCGGLFPLSRLLGFLKGSRAQAKDDPRAAYFGVSIGAGLTLVCLLTTRLVCLHTPYCDTSL